MTPLLNHPGQSTLFPAGIFAACQTWRANSARSRDWLWLADSMKFLIPFSALIALGTRVEHPRPSPVAGSLILLVRWFRRWRTVHSAARLAEEIPLRQPLLVLSSPLGLKLESKKGAVTTYIVERAGKPSEN